MATRKSVEARVSVYARRDVVKECLSPSTSSTCRYKALVHRSGTQSHIVWLARPFTCVEGLASQISTHTRSQVHIQL